MWPTRFLSHLPFIPHSLTSSLGGGKSTIATYLSDQTKTKVTIVHRIESVTNKEQATSMPLAARVLRELLQGNIINSVSTFPRAIHQITALSLSNKSVCDVAFQTLWDIVLGFVADAGDFTLIVDGLDECDEKSMNELSRELLALSCLPNPRVIVLFRHHPKLEKAFESCPTIEIRAEDTSNDIAKYLSEEIQRQPKLQLLKETDIDKILKSSQGMFLYATKMVDSLKTANTYKEQHECLEHPPLDLYKLYEKMGSSIFPDLTPTLRILRKEIFFILVASSRSLSCEEFQYVLSLDISKTSQPDNSDSLIDLADTVVRLCGSFVQILKNHVHLMHKTVKDFLIQPSLPSDSDMHIILEEAEAYLASKCLAALSREEYGSLNTIGRLIRRNVASAAEEDEDKYFYRYAATHWYVHLTAVPNPDQSLVKQASDFILGNEFLSWAEYVFQINGSQGTTLEVESKLKFWKKGLPTKRYFSEPYENAAKAFQDDAGDRTLPYLIFYQLGEYYNLAARNEEAFQVKHLVVEGLVGLLGERHPLSLMAESTFAFEYIEQRRFPEAEATFGKLAKIQREVLGEDRPDGFQSLQRQGMAELWMTKFSEADTNLTESLSGFSNTIGLTSFAYLMSQLTLGQVFEYQGEVRRALLDYERIWLYRVEILGKDNPMAVWARCAMASTFRKLGRFEDSDKALGEVIDSRTRTIGPKYSGTIDALIQRIVLYLDMARYEDGLELVDFLLDGDLVHEWFERTVQVDHMHALLKWYKKKPSEAISILKSLVEQADILGMEGKVRSMLWVRLDLATLLRKVGQNDEASILFDEIVVLRDHDSGCSWGEQQGPSELLIAEKALKLVREMKVYDAEQLLDKNGLKWAFQQYFWILNGAPPADTARMKYP